MNTRKLRLHKKMATTDRKYGKTKQEVCVATDIYCNNLFKMYFCWREKAIGSGILLFSLSLTHQDYLKMRIAYSTQLDNSTTRRFANIYTWTWMLFHAAHNSFRNQDNIVWKIISKLMIHSVFTILIKKNVTIYCVPFFRKYPILRAINTSKFQKIKKSNALLVDGKVIDCFLIANLCIYYVKSNEIRNSRGINLVSKLFDRACIYNNITVYAFTLSM